MINKLIKRWPKLSYFCITKLLWVVSFFYGIYVIQGSAPTLKQFILGFTFAALYTPIAWWLTYRFDDQGIK